jgi:zinc/manganese transport system substrate-binding protein
VRPTEAATGTLAREAAKSPTARDAVVTAWPRRHVLRGALAAAALATGGRAGAVEARRPADRPLTVVASFSILADMTREVAGPWAEVSAMVGTNADAHVFQPSPADVRRLARADLVVLNGLGFERWFDRLTVSAGYRGPVVRAADGIEVRRVGPVIDPHAWQSLSRARGYVLNIARGVIEAARAKGPTHRAEAVEAGVRQRTDDYLARLAALDARIRGWFEAVPPDRRHAITAHGAFGYLGAEYGVTFTSLGGWSTDSETSAAALARLIRQVRAQRATALFAENISDRRLLQRLADETGAALGGVLFSDALSPPGGPADTYLRLVEHNARTIARALQAGPARAAR